MKHLSFETIHEVGAKRHPATWFFANQAAVRWANARIDISDPANKELVSEIVLRVLDAVDTNKK